MPTTWTNPQATSAKQADRIRVSEAACTTGTEAIALPVLAWAGANIYTKGEFVVSAGECWLSLQNGNQGNPPVEGPWWTRQFGLNLKNLQAVGVAIELPAGNIGAGASLQMYIVNPATGQPNRAPSLDQALTANNPGEVTAGFKIDGPAGRLIALPNLVGQPCNIFLNGIPMPGILQS